jgi:hypothetical protein
MSDETGWRTFACHRGNDDGAHGVFIASAQRRQQIVAMIIHQAGEQFSL